MSKHVWSRIRTIYPVIFFAFGFPGILWADGIRILADLDYIISNSKTTVKETGETTESDNVGFFELYSLDMDKEIFPSLRLNGGGYFTKDLSKTDTNGTETETMRQSIRPYVEMEFNNLLYNAGLGYREAESKNTGTNAITTKTFSKEYSARFNWKPTELPSLAMNFNHILAHDEPLTSDSTNDTFNLASNYIYKNFIFTYSHDQIDTRQHLTNAETISKTDNGSVLYSKALLNKKVKVNAGVKLNHSATETSGSGPQHIRTTFPGSGFFLLDDPTPADNDADEFTAVDGANPLSTVNLGDGGGSNQISIGLDFGQEVAADTVYIVLITDEQNPDIATPGEIANVASSLSWRLFVSDDQQTWTEKLVTSAAYNQLENRFEISFSPAADNRYLKIVTTPLDTPPPGDPGEIPVSDLQAYTTVLGANRFTSTFRNANLGVDWKISERTSSGYTVFYQEQESNPGGTKRSILNTGINFRRIFSPIFTGTTRLLRQVSWQQGEEINTNYTYSAALNGKYLSTFTQALSYNGTYTEEPEGVSRTNAFVLRSNAQLYDGWSAIFDQGYSWRYPLGEEKTTKTFIRFGSNIIPNRKMGFTVDYSVSFSKQVNEAEKRDQSGRFRGTWRPLETVNLAADIAFTDTDAGDVNESVVLQDYSVNWSPLRHGSLQVSLGYNESTSSADRKERSFSSNLKWLASANAYVTLGYTKGSVDTATQVIDFDSVAMNLRIFY